MTAGGGAGSSEARGRGVNAEISTRIVGIMREYTGRGPTRARTYIEEDFVTCLLEDSLSRGELKVAEHSGDQAVLDHRRSMQNAMRRELEAMVEEVTGRRVVAFLSDNHVGPDYAIEVFVLAPLPEADRTSAGAEGGEDGAAA